MRLIRHWIIATILIGALAASACGGDEPTTPTAPTPSTTTTTTPQSDQEPTSLAIEGPDSLMVGATTQYQATITYSDGAERPGEGVEWVSGNTTVATVDDAGIVTGLRAGAFDLRAMAMGVSGSKTGIRVEALEATSLSVEGPDSLQVGQTVTYEALVTFSDGSTTTATDVEWASSNTTVATVDSDGRVTGRRAGGFDLRATAEGVTGRMTGIRVEPPPGPATSFGAGTWIVNEDIEPGRYYTNPSSGCYWERLSGLGGTSADRITNEFIGFNSGQEIVDIASSDRAFKPDADCGRWDRRPEPGPSSGTITPGRWLVGRQIQPGDYETNASPGCYWERLRGFSGESRDRITNDFVGDGGRVIVSIRSSDGGFYADDDCGSWSRRGGSSSNLASPGATDSFQIDQNYRRHRAEMGR